ncbi:MAG: hypothetical protein CVV41_07705 [Candidatus Riflebacteria bacterium HGW-Riflebacteria-1]|jgi:hypothetical protein|nr:MAG: hypothetical protein CVV41_07705 [Candidatus Riflebacteria bacterium HGW-Riflebacteria-1]
MQSYNYAQGFPSDVFREIELYGVETKVFNQAVSRNKDRFPDDFMFALTWEEAKALRSQFVTLPTGGHFRHPPRVFTEHGILNDED